MSLLSAKHLLVLVNVSHVLTVFDCYNLILSGCAVHKFDTHGCTPILVIYCYLIVVVKYYCCTTEVCEFL